MKPIDRFFRHYILSVIGILLLFFVINIVLICNDFKIRYAKGGSIDRPIASTPSGHLD